MNNYGSRHPPIFNVESRTGYASMNPYSYFFQAYSIKFLPVLSEAKSVFTVQCGLLYTREFARKMPLHGSLCGVRNEDACGLQGRVVCKEDANSGRQEAKPCMSWHGLHPGTALRAGRWFLLVTLCEDGICREHVVPKVSKHWTLALVRHSAHSQLGLSAAPSAPWCARRLQPGAGVIAANAAPITHISSLYWWSDTLRAALD